MFKRIPVLAGVVVFLLVSVAPMPRVRLQASSVSALRSDQAPASTLTLLSNGSAPRKALRYVVPAGTTARTRMSTEMSMAMEMGGMAMPEMKMPTMSMVAEMAISAVAANGDMSFSSSISDMAFDTTNANPMLAAGLADVKTDLSSVKTSGSMTSRGITSQQINFDAIQDPQLKQMMDAASTTIQQLSFPMPEEEVGVGAQWQTKQRMSSGGVNIDTVATVELVAVDGNKITLKVTTEQTAPPQTMQNPALPPEAEINLVDFSGSGSGTTVIDLTSLSTQSDTSMTMNMVMQINVQGMEQRMSMKSGMKMTAAPVK